MTLDQFKFQISRLESTFGERNFDTERLDLIMTSVMWMELGEFSKIVSHFIATFRSAPLPKDFKEAAMIQRHRAEKSQVRDSIPIFDENFKNEGLKNLLAKDYPGCKTLMEAIEVEKHRIKVRSALK